MVKRFAVCIVLALADAVTSAFTCFSTTVIYRAWVVVVAGLSWSADRNTSFYRIAAYAFAGFLFRRSLTGHRRLLDARSVSANFRSNTSWSIGAKFSIRFRAFYTLACFSIAS